MKERAKLFKVKPKRTTHEVSKRIGQAIAKPEEAKGQAPATDKRLNLGGGKWAHPASGGKDSSTPMQIN